MIRFDKALRAWGTPEFAAALKLELENNADILPLQQGLSHGNYVTDDPITVSINRVAETEGSICIKAGLYYQSVMGGCSCADDPTPVSENSEYCEVILEIDKETAATAISLVSE